METICDAADVTPPGFLTPPTRLFGEACERYPEVGESLHLELTKQRDVGGWVAPDDVPELLEFLNQEGSRIIQAATRVGVGATCTTLLRKIRECARYAEHHGMGYLEAAGVPALADQEV